VAAYADFAGTLGSEDLSEAESDKDRVAVHEMATILGKAGHTIVEACSKGERTQDPVEK
jgi:hypothetical protein